LLDKKYIFVSLLESKSRKGVPFIAKQQTRSKTNADLEKRYTPKKHEAKTS
jgi:hypothetical protein